MPGLILPRSYARGQRYDVTLSVPNFGMTGVGYASDAGGFGQGGAIASLYPFAKGLLADCTIKDFLSYGSADFVIGMIQGLGLPAQNFFRGVWVEDGTGTMREYLTASATFSAGTVAYWSWGTGSSQVWQAGDTGETHPLLLFF
jgi:hypothetical protein